MSQKNRIAAIDVGSNSLHMVIVDLHEDGLVEFIDREKEMVRLGAGVYRTGSISKRAWRDGLTTMESFAALAESTNATRVIGVATSACREAKNGSAFLSAVEQRTGIRVRLISGREEARLIHAAVTWALDMPEGRSLIIDIGGGSVELVASEGLGIERVVSVNLGVQRLLDTVGHSGPIGDKERNKLIALVNREIDHVLESAGPFDLTVGTSGTIEALAAASRELDGAGSWRHPNGEVVTREQLQRTGEALGEMTVSERQEKLGIAARRADAIHLGAVVLVRMLEIAGVTELTICDASLREGVVAREIEQLREGWSEGDARSDLTVRDRAVYQLAARFGVTSFSAAQVCRLATLLFDGLRQLHGLREEHRQLLMDACRLYDIGRAVHRKRRHKHARYLVQHARLRGFTQREIDLLRLVVRYHRRALPKKKHKRFRRLKKGERRVVSVLAGILRIAIALDRRHAGAVRGIDVAHGGGEAVIVCRGDDIGIELDAARAERALLERALGIDLVVRERSQHYSGARPALG